MRYFLIFIIVSALFSSCENDRVNAILEQVDTLAVSGNIDSASAIMNRIDTSRVSKQEDKMYYLLLQTQLQYRSRQPMEDSTVIDKCLQYYKSTNNRRLLSLSYYYKGIFEYEKGNSVDAVMLLKKAEEVAAPLHDLELKHKIYESLSTLNFMSGNIDLAMRYSELSLNCAQKTGDELWLVYAYDHLACLYEAKGQMDSCWYYNQKSLSYIKSVDSIDQAQILSLVGDCCLRQKDEAKAKDYFMQSYKIYPLPETCNKLANIFSKNGMEDKAHEMWGNALKHAGPSDRVQILDAISKRQFEEGDYKNAFLTQVRLGELRDSLSKLAQTVKIQEIQLKYDQQTEKRQFDQTLIKLLYILIGLILLFTIMIIYHIQKANRAKQKMLNDNILINDYNRKIVELQKSGKDAEKDINRLKHKIEKIQSEQTNIMFEGHALYESVLNNKSVIRWTKSDIDKFIEYYKAVNLPFVMQLDRDFSGLTNRNKLFLILQDMGKTDEEMTQILGTSSGAIRTTRHRLKGKLRDANLD